MLAARRQLIDDERAGADAVRRLLRVFDERKARALFEAVRGHYAGLSQADNLAQLLLQLHLKHVEMAGDMVSAYRRLHFTTAATLSRTLLEGGVTLLWAIAHGDDAEAGYDQLLRFLAKSYQEQERQAAKGKAAPLGPGERQVVAEASARGLREMPDLAGRMRDIDKVWAEGGSASAASDHYSHFGMASGFTHPSRFGPAQFALTPAGISVFTQGQTLLGAAALYYGACYFCVGYLCSSTLAGLEAEATWMTGRLTALQADLSPIVERELLT